MKQNLLFNQASALGKRLAMVLTMLLIVGIRQTWGATFNVVYDYSTKGDTWTLTDCEDKSSYWLCPASGTSSVAAIPDIFTGKTITSDVVITINNATYGSGNGPSTSTFKIYNSSACTTQVSASQSGTLASSSTYVNTIYTITKANAANFSKDFVLLITKPGRQIRLKSITVKFSYENAAPPVMHKAYFYNGTTLLNTGGTEFAEGAAVSYSGSTPTSCDGESVTFVGWATSTWEGKVTKGDITPDFYDITAGDDLPKMGTADVNYYAVFARETSTTTNKTLTLNSTNLSSAMGGSYSSTDFSYSGISFGRSNAAIMSNTIQIKGGTSNAVWNKTELPGAITSITVTKKTNNSVLTVGTSAQPTTNSKTVSSTTTYTFTESNNYRYFKIAATSSYTQVTSVVIKYSATSYSYSDYITTCTTETVITLHPNGGTIGDNKWTLKNGVYKLTTEDESITLPTITRTGYTFGGWATSSGGTNEHDENAIIPLDGTPVTLYAIWTANKYDITYKDQGGLAFSGTHEGGYPTQHTYGIETTLKGATKTGYTFEGWYTDAACTNKVTTLGATEYTGDITLYAKWEEIPTTCTITYDANGGKGTITDATEYANGAKVTVKGNFGIFTKDGYAFTGWNTQADGSGDSYKHNDQFTITANTTLHAQWCKAYWKLVTTKSELENDTRIVIAAKDYNFALSTTQNDANRGQAAITKKYNTITFGADVQTLSVVGPVNNNFALYSPGPHPKGYLYAASNSANQLKTKTIQDNNCYWSIAISQGVATILAQGTYTNNQLKYNAGSDLFSCYGEDNNQKDVVIYKEVCVQDQYNVTSTLTNTTATNTNPTTVAATATTLTLEYSANTSYLLPETIIVKMGGVELVSGTDYTWNKEDGTLTFSVTGFYGDIDVKIVAEEDPCYQFVMSTVTATSNTPNTITLTWTEVAGATGYNVKIGTGEFTPANGLTHTFEGLSPKTPYNWEVQAVKDGDGFHCEASKTGSTTTQKETFTVSWSVNGNVTSTESVVDGESIQDTPSTPSDQTLEDCGANKFMGWSEKSAGSTPQDAAYYDDLCSAEDMIAKYPSITSSKTFYAVFATEEPSNTTTTSTTTISGANSGTIANVLSWSSSKNDGTAITAWNDNHFRLYPNKSNGNGSSITITPVSGVTISEVVLTATSTTYAKPVKYNIDGGSDISGTWNSTTMTISDINATTSFKFRNAHIGANNDQVRVTVSVTYSKGETITTYSNYVTNCCELLPVTNLQVSGVTEKSATLTWTAPSPTTGITKLQVRNAETNDIVVDDIAVNTTTATITELRECISYQYYVVSVGDCEVFSNTVTATPFSGAKTVYYDYNGGSGSPESFTTSCDDDKREIILPVATRPGYTFEGWYDSEENKVGDAGATYDPATSPITLYAHWKENIYQLTHSGSNYTNTENKTSIKSSETPFTLHYTCTGDYGLPATISITGGGKSWTINTDYTWEVAADKQSATLVIKETVISANVTITINVATRYTVTFVHNDKGVFSGSETIEVLSSENTITLPTVTDVSCGFYDTFEGWIEANEDYTESTSKPAGTIYKGGANYTVNSDCTLRALYSKCEGDATQVYRKVTSTGEVTDGTYILVANTSTPRVYSGYGGATYGSSVDGLTADGEDFSTTLPVDAKPITVTTGTGTNAGTFAMYNADRTKYLTYTGSSNTLDESDSKVFIWKLTDGLDVNSRSCPAGVLTPNGFDTRVLQCNTSSSNRFACYTNNASFPHVFLYKLIDKCTKYYSTNPSCEKPVGVHIVYNANAVDASMSCIEQNRTYKVENEVNKYPQLASQLQFCTNATREGYTLVGWNTQYNGQGTTYNINQNYYNLPVSGELDGDKWITLNLYAMWKPCIKFNLGNATGGTGVPDAVVENRGCVLPTPTAEQLGTIPCGYEFYAWSETSVNATQTKPALFMPGDTYTGSALTLYAVYRWCEGNTGSDTYYFTFIVDGQTYCITKKHSNYARFVVEEATSGLIFGIENDYLYYLDENGVKNYVYYEGSSTTVTTTTTYPNSEQYKTTFADAGDGTTIVKPAINNNNRTLQFTGTGNLSDDYDRAYYTTGGTNPTLVEVQSSTCTYATNPTCYTNTNLHFVTNGGILNYPTDYDETNYQELTPGTTVLLPTATFAGEWTFEGWKRGSQLESQTIKPYDPSFYPVTLNSTQFEVDDLGDIYFYAVYSKTNDDKQFDPVNGGTYKLFAIGADGTKTYMPIWNGGRGTMSGVTTCAETGDYTITPGTGTHAGQYQITCGEYTLGVVGDVDQTDLNEVEGTWWNISQSTSGKGTWRITVVGSSLHALSCSFSTAKSFGNYAISNLNNPSQSIYRDMEIGECIYTEYTSTPENIPYITITGAPVKITSTNGERVYASTTLHIEAHNFTSERIIHLSATNGFGVDPVRVHTNGQGAYSGDVKVYYEPTTDGDGQTITTSVLTASQTGGTNAEKISQTFAAIQGRNMPANFVIAAKWDGHWYALPANCTSSLSSTEGLLIEVDDVDNPTIATAAPASAKYGLREVIPSRQTDHGQGIVFTERFAEGDKQFALYNGSDANIQVNAQYSNYAQSNPDKYEWIPTTSDFNEYTMTNASTGRNLGLTSGSFGAYAAANNQVRLLPATFYEPAPVQVLKWKENSVIVMFTGAEATATTQVGDNAKSAEQTLANQRLTHGIYELTTNQALTDHAGGELNIYIGTNTRVELEIPLIISGKVTASANAHDVVILENSKLTAAETKYSYKDVYVYGGAKLAIPENTELGVNNIILRAGGVATDGAGQNATYQYIYPQVELKGTLTSAVQNIRYEYVTDNDHWYHLVLPFDGSLTSIHYPYEYYGDQVKLDNKGSWIIKRYDGATRATGNYDAWKDIEKDEPKATIVTAGKGYIFWGAPKKITANDKYDRPTWGIQRITMLSDVSETISKAKDAENNDKTISGLSSYKDVAYNSGAVNDQGWNLIGNPYMVNLTTMSEVGLKAGKLVEERVDGKWTGKWINNGDNLRYLTIPSEHFDTYEAKTVDAAITANYLVPGRAFFVQLEGEADGVTFAAANRASLMPALRAANDKPVDIETGIVLSNETLQDEVNFWIKAGKTNDYEYNADYPKTPNNNHFNIYGVHTNGDLSWVATDPEYAAESMHIGYQVPAAGTYMLSLSEIYNSDGLDALYVTDHALSPEVTVDIMSEPYEFSVNQAETNNERFTVSVRVKAKTENGATGLGNVGADGEQIHKFIYQDKMYILHHGVIYDATGKRVITINK